MIPEHLLSEEITVEPFTGHSDAYGTATYGTAVTLKARVSRKPHATRDNEGREVVSSATAWVNTVTTTIDPKDRVTLADGSQPAIVRVERITVSLGRTFTRITFL